MMAVYDLLAPYYDAVTGDSAAEAAFIRDIVERRHSQAATLLDLACGTGSITGLLAGAYEVSGLDISPGMLAVARGKVPSGTELYLDDMTSFRLAARFDVIVCAYQGINHLLSLAAWKSSFDRACEHLSRGGLFVFDITTLSHLQRMASIPQVVEEFAGNYLLIQVRTADGMVFDWDIELYELQQDGKYRLLTQTISLRSFPLPDIREALRARFTSIEIISDGNSADTQGQDRIWFVCRKPALPVLRQLRQESAPGHTSSEIGQDLAAFDPGLNDFFLSSTSRPGRREMPSVERVIPWPFRMLAAISRPGVASVVTHPRGDYQPNPIDMAVIAALRAAGLGSRNGGGSELAQSTDFIIASENATFGQPEDADDRRPDHRHEGARPYTRTASKVSALSTTTASRPSGTPTTDPRPRGTPNPPQEGLHVQVGPSPA
jgi:SAM-dependent methyltransferase